MPNYAVIYVDSVPAVGTEKSARIYQGNHTTELEAATAAAAMYSAPSNTAVWVTLASNLARHTVSRSVSYSAVAG